MRDGKRYYRSSTGRKWDSTNDVAKWAGVSGALDLAKAAPDDVLIWPHFMGTAAG